MSNHRLTMLVLSLAAVLVVPRAAAQTAPQPDLPCLDCCPDPPCDPIGPPPPSEPPVRAAFYYPWWDGYDTVNDRPRRKWSDCTMTWSTEDGDTGDHYHPDFNGNGLFEKEIDLYDDGLLSTMVTHMERMSSAAVGGLIASWWGPSSGSGSKFPNIWDAAVNVPSVDVTGYYETAQRNGTTLGNMQQFLDTMLGYYIQDSSRFLKTADGRPVLFVYDPGNHDCARLDQWKTALDYGEQTYGVRAFLVVDMGNEVPSHCTNWNPPTSRGTSTRRRRARGTWRPGPPGSSRPSRSGPASGAAGTRDPGRYATSSPGRTTCSRPTRPTPSTSSWSRRGTSGWR